MPKLSLKIIQEIKAFCESLPEPPVFFLILNCKSTRNLYQHSIDNAKTELLVGERLRQFQARGRLSEILVLFVPQLNEFVAQLRGADLNVWDDTKKKWFDNFVLPCLRCPISRKVFEHPVLRLTIGLPEGMFEGRYDLRLGHVFERDTYHQSEQNPFDEKNPFFPRSAILPDSWTEMIAKVQQVEAEDFTEDLVASGLKRRMPHPEHEPLAIAPVPVIALEQPLVAAPIQNDPIALHPALAAGAEDSKLWVYSLAKILFETVSFLAYFQLGKGEYRAQIGRFPADLVSYQLKFSQTLHSFLTRYPDCSSTLPNGERPCDHACFTLFMNTWKRPYHNKNFFFSPSSIKSSIIEDSILFFMVWSLNIFLGGFSSMVYIDLDSSRFNQLNLWSAPFKNKKFLFLEVGSFCMHSILNLLAFYTVGNDVGASSARVAAFDCAFPDSFRTCEGVPKECHMLEDTPYTNSYLNQFLLQCGLFFGTLFLPKIVHWLYDDMPKVARQAVNTASNLLGGVSRFFCRFSSHSNETHERGHQEDVAMTQSFPHGGEMHGQ